MSETTEDYTVFGDTWVYCSQHMRPHPTGWCTVSPRDKVGLGTTDPHKAYDKCRALGLPIYNEPRPDPCAALRAERDALAARVAALEGDADRMYNLAVYGLDGGISIDEALSVVCDIADPDEADRLDDIRSYADAAIAAVRAARAALGGEEAQP